MESEYCGGTIFEEFLKLTPMDGEEIAGEFRYRMGWEFFTCYLEDECDWEILVRELEKEKILTKIQVGKLSGQNEEQKIKFIEKILDDGKYPRVTRQHISNLLKSSLRKVYNCVRRGKNLSPFEIACQMLYILGIGERGPEEIEKFFKLFPPDLRRKIITDGREKNRRTMR